MQKFHKLFAVALIVLSLATVAIADDAEGSAQPAASGVVNINTAEVAQLQLLPRIGPAAAQRIVDYRKENGPFRKATDLMQVKGIGEKSFETLRPYVTVDGKTTLSKKVSGPKRTSKKAPQKAQQ